MRAVVDAAEDILTLAEEWEQYRDLEGSPEQAERARRVARACRHLLLELGSAQLGLEPRELLLIVPDGVEYPSLF